MRDFLEEIAACINAGIYSPALASAMLVPDACGAIEYPELRNGERYRTWFDAYLPEYSRAGFSGAVAWKLRNGMLHETALTFKDSVFERVVFSAPDGRRNISDMNLFNLGERAALNIYLPFFCNRMISACLRG